MVYLDDDMPTTSVFMTEADFDEFTLTNLSVRDQLAMLVVRLRISTNSNLLFSTS